MRNCVLILTSCIDMIPSLEDVLGSLFLQRFLHLQVFHATLSLEGVLFWGPAEPLTTPCGKPALEQGPCAPPASWRSKLKLQKAARTPELAQGVLRNSNS